MARRPEMLHTVGSFSHSVPMLFDFSARPSLRATCRFVLRETARMLACDVLPRTTAVPTVAWELNDIRPVPRPTLLNVEGRASNVKSFDLFFMVNEYADGFDAVLLYDSDIYDRGAAEELVSAWMELWHRL